jgi:hypothetical protein
VNLMRRALPFQIEKAAEAASCFFRHVVTSRKTAGLFALRASVVNDATLRDRPGSASRTRLFFTPESQH